MKRALIIAALACLQCGPKVRMLPRDAPVPWEKSGIDWSKPPALAAPLPFVPPRAETFELANGLRVIVVENHRLPLVSLAMVHMDAGSRADGAKPGLAALTAELLDKGASAATRASSRDDLDLAGARLETHIATDSATIEVLTTSKHLDKGMVALADMVMAPPFEPPQVALVRSERVAEITARRQRPRTIAAQTFDRVVFDGHPYGLPADGDPKVVASLTAEQVHEFWARAYRPDRATLVLVGDVYAKPIRPGATVQLGYPADARMLAERAFGTWKAGTGTATGTAANPSGPALGRYTPQLALVDIPGARQSVVLIGQRAAAAGDSHALVDDVANAIVGGGLGARLDHELHEKLGLTLGASASYWRGRWAGSWALATTFATDKTLEGIRVAQQIVDGARTTITADEVARAKQNLLVAAQQAFDTTASTARAFERLVTQGLPLDGFASYERRLAAITLADVRAASAWQALSIVVVGDRAKLEPALGELGLPIVHYTADGMRQ